MFASYSAETFKKDFLSSIVVFLVALPLCMGIAIACGVPPALGIITGVIGGLVVGYFSGCPLQVSGPAAGLITIIWEIVQQHGVEGLGIIVLLAGLMQVSAGLLRIGQWFRAVSPAVINGMLSGIGVLIFASQFHIMVDDTPKGSGVENLLSIPEAIYKGIFPIDGSVHHLAAGIGVLAIGLILLWNLVPARFKVVPGPLVAVIGAILAATIFQLPINYVEIPGNLLNAVSIPSLSGVMGMLGNPGIWVSAITIAFVASAETLLTATAVEQMRPDVKTRYNKEMVSQGIGNTLCGLLGTLPMTGVIVRSSANVQSGAQTRMSTMMHGAWLFILVLLFPFLLEKIPVASLAAILVYTGYKLINPQKIKKLAEYGKSEVAIYFVTMVAIVLTNLLEGVLIGFGLATLKLLYTLCRLDVVLVKDPTSPQATLFLKGSATFMNLPKLATALETVQEGLELNLHIDQLAYLDHAALELLSNWEKQYAATGGSVTIQWHELTARIKPHQPTDERNRTLGRQVSETSQNRD